MSQHPLNDPISTLELDRRLKTLTIATTQVWAKSSSLMRVASYTKYSPVDRRTNLPIEVSILPQLADLTQQQRSIDRTSRSPQAPAS